MRSASLLAWTACVCSLLACEASPPPATEDARPVTTAPHFSHTRGLHTQALPLVVQPPSPEASLAVTTDGSIPEVPADAAPGVPVSLTIAATTVVRAVARLPGHAESPVVTHTFIFPERVVQQPATPAALPAVLRVRQDRDAELPLDAAMDPAITSDPVVAELMTRSLEALPTIAVTLPTAELFGLGGLYTSGGLEDPTEHEARAAVEVLFPDAPGDHRQVDAGLRVHTWVTLKRSLRLMFRGEYGAGKLRTPLLERDPAMGQGADDTLDRLILRAGKNRNWTTRWNPDDSTFTRDQWVRASQLAMSGYAARGTFVHLYLNGLYWGVYNAVERPDQWFMASYFGGDEDDWFVANHNGLREGDTSAWNTLTQSLVERDASRPEVLDQWRRYLDLEDFADYLILNFYAGTWDWPGNNFYAAHRLDPPGPVRFFVWDAEESWDAECSSGPYDQPGGGGSDGAWVPPPFLPGNWTRWIIPTLWHALRRSPEFMTLFADRVHRHLTGDGALTDARSQARWQLINDHLYLAVLAESARWGDARAELGEPTRTMQGSWLPEVRRVHDRMAGNGERLVAALRAVGFYPPVDPPTPLVSGQGSEARLVVSADGQAGEVWYTLDGGDPRAPGGAVAEGARRFTGPVPLPPGSVVIKARLLQGGHWSALAERTASGAPDRPR